MSGPLNGTTIIEFAGLGPAPYCGMLLADLGADVIRVDRPGGEGLALAPDQVLQRGKRSIVLDLKTADGLDVAGRLCDRADAVIEGFRPGVAERLGLGPEECLARNPNLVYGRMTGWGQDGPLAATAGHDIDYLAVSGALHPIGTEDKPIPPLNLAADFGGGAMFLAVGVLAGILHARAGGGGQVVDAAMVDGAAHLTTVFHGLMAAGMWSTVRRSNLLDGGAPFYDTYETADGHHLAVGALEPQFYSELIDRLGLAEAGLPDRFDRAEWPRLRTRLAQVFRTRTRDQWAEVFEGSDACVAPVMSLAEAPHHPHNRARRVFVEVGGVTQPAPAPRFSTTPTALPAAPTAIGAHSREILLWLGLEDDEVDRLLLTLR
ncbi:MAG: CaiB/BaiF CoA transferase family protein [Acidimicrobiia bacterium]